MGWYGSGWGAMAPFVWGLMALVWAGLIVLIVWLVARLLPSSGSGQASSTQGSGEAPEEVLDRMFVLGEIDEQTYRARRTALGEMRRPS